MGQTDKEMGMSEWLLTPDEEADILHTAQLNKNDHRRWLNRGRGWVDTGDIPLTDEQKRDILEHANRMKQFRYELEQMRDENRARRLAEEKKEREAWTYERVAKHMKEEAAKRGTKLDFNGPSLPLIKAVCFRISGNERYETECGLSFQRGLIVNGPPGIGKTFIWQLVANNPVCPVQIITMHEIVRAVKETGKFDGVRFADFPLIYIDDVGTEYMGDNAIKYYGTEINWFKDFIEIMYAKHKQHLSRVIISTNDSEADLWDKYGFRAHDRLAECFDFMQMDGESYRGSAARMQKAN